MNKLHAFLVEAALLPVKFYRKVVSRGTRQGKCKYLPTCSQYALDAFREWGVFCGFFLTVWRVLRCNPFSKGGYDPVPERKRKGKQKDAPASENNENNENDERPAE